MGDLWAIWASWGVWGVDAVALRVPRARLVDQLFGLDKRLQCGAVVATLEHGAVVA